MSSREGKNMMIREKGKATRLKRRSQTCRTFRFKIDKSSLKKEHCFYCGSDTKHEPSKRTFVCSVCGYKEDRDIHAAKNMIQFYNIKNNPPGTNGYKPKQKALKILS